MIKKLKQLFCIHKWKCIYVYGLSADFECKKCGKYKKDFLFYSTSTKN